MSENKRMNIRFGVDMPTTSVQILTPELETIQQIALSAGEQVSIDVPSVNSFIRLLLPSGRAVTLRHGGDLKYQISRGSLISTSQNKHSQSSKRSIGGLRTYNRTRSLEISDIASFRSNVGDGVVRNADLSMLTLPGGQTVRWTPNVEGTILSDGEELAFTPRSLREPYKLVIEGQKKFSLSIPGNIEAAFVRSDLVNNRYVTSVRIATSSSDADTVGGYLAQGNYFAAETMAGWAKNAERMLQRKQSDPYAATVAAYLLLRLERYDLMHDWSRNLTVFSPDIPDGFVIWATQCVLALRDKDQAQTYIDQGIRQGLPVYTEGLRWLAKTLRLLGDYGAEHLRQLGENTRGVLWNSPFTSLYSDLDNTMPPVTLDVAYATRL